MSHYSWNRQTSVVDYFFNSFPILSAQQVHDEVKADDSITIKIY